MPGRAARLAAPGRPIWIQAVSVGELAVAFSFMDELRHRRPATRFVLTTNTSTGHALALKRIAPPDVTLYFPMDVPWVVPRALRRIRPAAIVLVENELWPNLIRYAARQGIPTIMINGRISEHSFRGYRRIRFLTRRLLPQLIGSACRAPGTATACWPSARPRKIEVTGSAKCDIGDAADLGSPAPRCWRYRREPATRCWWAGGPGATRRCVAGYCAEGARAIPADAGAGAPARGTPRGRAGRHPPAGMSRSCAASSPTMPRRPCSATMCCWSTTGVRGFYAAARVCRPEPDAGGRPIRPARTASPWSSGPTENFRKSPGFPGRHAWRQVRDAAELQRSFCACWDCEERARLGKAAAGWSRGRPVPPGMALRVLESSVWE